MMAGLQEFSLRWNNHTSALTCVFVEVLKSEVFCDCTLVAEGQSIEVHRILLSACSPYFKDVLSQHRKKDPIIILKDVTFRELSVLVEYMYHGQVNIRENELQSILKVAENLQIKGLSDSAEKVPPANSEESRPPKRPVQPTVPRYSFPVAENRRSSYQGDFLPTDSPGHGNESSVPAKRMRRRRTSKEDSVLGTVQIPTETPLPPLPVSLPSPLPTTPVIPMPTPTIANLDQILPEAAVEPKPKTELLEPKQEIEDVNGSDNYEDLTLDDDDSMNMDNSQPGPSMGSESSSNQGFPPWQLGADGSMTQDDMAAQDNAGGSQVFDAVSLPRNLISMLEHGKKPSRFYCPNCSRSYTRKDNLTKHMKYECGKEPQFQCPHCPYRGAQKGTVQTHVFNRHKHLLP